MPISSIPQLQLSRNDLRCGHIDSSFRILDPPILLEEFSSFKKRMNVDVCYIMCRSIYTSSERATETERVQG